MKAPIVAIGRESIARAVSIVAKGGLIVYPTDTVYGLGCDPFNGGAVGRLFAAKERSGKPIPVLCSSPQKASDLVVLSNRALQLARAHWPGAITIVAPLRRNLPPLLSQGTSGLGVRVPASPLCLELIKACGGWLTGTSANLSGHPSAKSAKEAQAQLGGSVELILDGGRLKGRESTVVRVIGDEVTILRGGPVRVADEMSGRRT